VTTHRPAAVLWDMDGTLVNSEPYWMTAEAELVHEYGGAWTPDDGLGLVGKGLWDSARILQRHGVRLGEDDIVHRLTERVMQQLTDLGTPWRPGARELLSEVREAGIPNALVTMSMRRMAELVIEGIGFDAFDVLVTGDDVVNPKPHPEPYLRAAELLEVAPADSVAIEDSVPGVASAVAAGMIVVAVPFIAEIPDSDDHTTWPTLEGRGVRHLRELAATVASR
jgi:HAD superfamily hydrolase (TIGR01509 family)